MWAPGPNPTYPHGKSLYKPYITCITWVCMGYNPQESLENTINTMGTLLGVHPIVPWNVWFNLDRSENPKTTRSLLKNICWHRKYDMFNLSSRQTLDIWRLYENPIPNRYERCWGQHTQNMKRNSMATPLSTFRFGISKWKVSKSP